MGVFNKKSETQIDTLLFHYLRIIDPDKPVLNGAGLSRVRPTFIVVNHIVSFRRVCRNDLPKGCTNIEHWLAHLWVIVTTSEKYFLDYYELTADLNRLEEKFSFAGLKEQLEQAHPESWGREPE